jgi:hypothetical protein
MKTFISIVILLTTSITSCTKSKQGPPTPVDDLKRKVIVSVMASTYPSGYGTQTVWRIYFTFDKPVTGQLSAHIKWKYNAAGTSYDETFTTPIYNYNGGNNTDYVTLHQANGTNPVADHIEVISITSTIYTFTW